MTDSRRVSYFYDVEIGNYHYGQGINLTYFVRLKYRYFSVVPGTSTNVENRLKVTPMSLLT